MKTISASPQQYLAVRPGSPHWEILCTPGPLANLLHHLAGFPGLVPVEETGLAVIPLTPELDAGLVHLVDSFIDLRYETGRVQLELFAKVM